MKYEISTGIYGSPVRLHLRVELHYGDKEQYRTHVISREFSMDSGGKVYVTPEQLQQFAEEILQREQKSKGAREGAIHAN